MLDRRADVQPLLLEPLERGRVDLGQRLGRRVPVRYLAVHDLEVAAVQAACARRASVSSARYARAGTASRSPGYSAAPERRAYSRVRSWKR